MTDERGSSELFYLGAAGTCKRLYSRDEALGVVSYGPTLNGSYTYAPTPGKPSEAVLKLNFPDGRQNESFGLEFSGDTQGSVRDVPSIGTEVFSILLRIPGSQPPKPGSGFVVGGPTGRLVLARAAGPGPLAPRLDILSGGRRAASGHARAAQTGYDARAMDWISGLAGVAPPRDGTDPAEFFGPLPPGAYSADADAGSLVEVVVLPYSG